MTAYGPPSTVKRTRRTSAELDTLGETIISIVAAVYGCGRTKAYELYHRSELDFPAIRAGARIVVPVAPLLELLGVTRTPSALSATPDMATASASPAPAAALTLCDPPGGRSANRTPPPAA